MLWNQRDGLRIGDGRDRSEVQDKRQDLRDCDGRKGLGVWECPEGEPQTERKILGYGVAWKVLRAPGTVCTFCCEG